MLELNQLNPKEKLIAVEVLKKVREIISNGEKEKIDKLVLEIIYS